MIQKQTIVFAKAVLASFAKALSSTTKFPFLPLHGSGGSLGSFDRCIGPEYGSFFQSTISQAHWCGQSYLTDTLSLSDFSSLSCIMHMLVAAQHKIKWAFFSKGATLILTLESYCSHQMALGNINVFNTGCSLKLRCIAVKLKHY